MHTHIHIYMHMHMHILYTYCSFASFFFHPFHILVCIKPSSWLASQPKKLCSEIMTCSDEHQHRKIKIAYDSHSFACSNNLVLFYATSNAIFYVCRIWCRQLFSFFLLPDRHGNVNRSIKLQTVVLKERAVQRGIHTKVHYLHDNIHTVYYTQCISDLNIRFST